MILINDIGCCFFSSSFIKHCFSYKSYIVSASFFIGYLICSNAFLILFILCSSFFSLEIVVNTGQMQNKHPVAVEGPISASFVQNAPNLKFKAELLFPN